MVGYDYKSGGEEKRVPDISKTYYGLENRIITLNGRKSFYFRNKMIMFRAICQSNNCCDDDDEIPLYA